MGVPDQIGTGARAHAVANASTVAKIRAVGDAEGVAGLSDGDPRELPTAEKLVFQITAFKEGQGIDIADSKIVALIEIGAAAISSNVIRIHERPVEAVRRIVDGMAVSVCDAQSEIAHGAAR